MLMRTSVNLKVNYEQMTQIMFESFNVPKIYAHIQPASSLYVSGRSTGPAPDSGDGVAHTMPIYVNMGMLYAILRFGLKAITLCGVLVGGNGLFNVAFVHITRQRSCI